MTAPRSDGDIAPVPANKEDAEAATALAHRAPLLKSFDPRPLHGRAKVVLPLIACVAFTAIAMAEILFGNGNPDVIERCVTWAGLAVLMGTGTIGIDDARTKPILARALSTIVARSPALPAPSTAPLTGDDP